MFTTENVTAISDEFQSTFMMMNEVSISNLLFEKEIPEVEAIIKKHVGNVHVEFLRTNQLSKDPEAKDIWVILIQQAS